MLKPAVFALALVAAPVLSQEHVASQEAWSEEVTEFLADAEVRLSPEESWEAVEALRDLAPGLGSKDARKLVGQFKVALGKAESVRATQLVLAVGFLGEQAGSLAGPIAERLEESRDPELRLACAVTLASLGKEGVKEAMGVVKSRNLVGSALACGTVLRRGQASSTAQKALLSVTKDKDFRAFLLSQSAIEALRFEGEKVQSKARSNQEKVYGKIRVPPSEGFNWIGMAQIAPSGFLENLKHLAGLEDSKESYAIPHSGPPSGKGLVLHGYANFLHHLTGAPKQVGTLFEEPELPAWDAYVARSRPWVLTLELLQIIEEKGAPR